MYSKFWRCKKTSTVTAKTSNIEGAELTGSKVMKRIVTLDFQRGLAIFMMVFFVGWAFVGDNSIVDLYSADIFNSTKMVRQLTSNRRKSCN